MEIQHSTRRGCAVVAFGGTIDLASVATVQRTLLKELSEQPDALICDLAGVQHLDPMAAAVFSTVAKHPASRWPTTSFLLCGARPQVAEALRRVRASRLVRMYATVEEAVKAARARPPVVQDELRLELRADRLFIAVRDRGPKELQPVPPAPEVEGGRGLWLVEQLARAWGVRSSSDGGKTVWCALTL